MSTTYTVTQINNNVDNLLQTKFANISIQGEISSFNISPSGHAYYTLKDESSELSCVMFSSQLKKYKEIMIVGNTIIVKGIISLYKPKGIFQFKSFLASVLGEGEFWKEFEKLKLKLSNEGLFDDVYKKEIPLYIKKIIIITSLNGVVKDDIINIIRRRCSYQKICIYPVTVQGENAVAEISSAIDDININHNADIIIIARGGGAIEDLWPFNNEKLARTIFDSNIPVMSAIGHESDFTICDFVSDKRASTPSDAAELVSISQEDMLQYLDELYSRLENKIKKHIITNRENLIELENKKVLLDPLESINILKNKVIDTYKFININIVNILNSNKAKVELFGSNLSNLSPYNVLDRGYALLLDKDKNPISLVEKVKVGDQIYSSLKDGELKMEVINKDVKDK
tara:strand:+ start:279 stop:1481 length:1203 start_codon:yes stop_codon:yes gene_type:complete